MWTAFVADRPTGAAAAGFAWSDSSHAGTERHGYLPILRFTLWRKHRP